MYRYRLVGDSAKARVAIDKEIATNEVRRFMGEILLSEILGVKVGSTGRVDRSRRPDAPLGTHRLSHGSWWPSFLFPQCRIQHRLRRPAACIDRLSVSK